MNSADTIEEILRENTTLPLNVRQRIASELSEKMGVRKKFNRDKVSSLHGTIYKVPVALPDRDGADTPQVGKMYVTVAGLNGRPLEVFVTIGKAGGDASIMADCIARLISGWLQDGVDSPRVLKHLIGMASGTRVPWPAGGVGFSVRSVPDGIGKAIKKWIGDNNENVVEKP